MSLNSALEVGRSAIFASQTGLQVAGHNLANAATEGYSRQRVHLAPIPGQDIGRGIFVGRGVQVEGITSAVDTALQARLRDAISQEHGSLIDQQFLSALEALQGELSENDVSSLLSDFFNSFSELANNPQDESIRSLVIEQGRNLAGRLTDLRGEYERVVDEIDRGLAASVETVDDLLGRIAAVNVQVVQAEAGAGQAGGLRDQRAALIDELAQYVDVSVYEQPGGAVNVMVGSVPVVIGGDSRGAELRVETVNGQLEVSVRTRADGSTLNPPEGRIGALLQQREQTMEPALDQLDTLAGQLMHQVNRVHAQGQGLTGVATAQGTYAITDSTVNLNTSAAGLPFPIENGTVQLHVTHAATGTRTTHQIAVDGDAMSLDDLIARINAVAGADHLTSSAGPGNRLTLTADAGYEISFSDDSSGVLAGLGLNTFFTGADATDIDVHEALLDNPGRLAAGAGHVPGSNDNALALALLQDSPVDELDGTSLREFWQNATSSLAVQTAAAHDAVDAAQVVRESLSAQKQSVTGVSVDEEMINLLTYQRQFQAAARFISVIEQTLQMLLSIA
jgi:flagellar hook-associated protein 1 FlgK